MQTALAHGIDIGDLRARRAEPEDFQRFDLILAIDQDNFRSSQQERPRAEWSESSTCSWISPPSSSGVRCRTLTTAGNGALIQVLDMTEAAARGLLDHITRRLLGTGERSRGTV